MKSRSAQTAIESVVLISILIFFVIAIFMVLYDNLMQKNYVLYSTETLRIAQDVKDEIALAHKAGEGYHREFTLPSRIVNIGYNITLTPGSIYLITSDEKHALRLSSLNATGEVVSGINSIRMENGTVYLNG